MRLFIAAELPEEMTEAVAETQAMLRECVKGRFTAYGNLHVTLAFLGDVPGRDVRAAEEALERGCAGHAAFRTRLGELGSFGKRTDATLWQGFSPSEPFTALGRSIRSELDAAGLDYDRKALRAHVTIMRRARLDAGALPMPLCAAGTVERVTLFASELTPDGPRYTVLKSCMLAGA